MSLSAVNEAMSKTMIKIFDGIGGGVKVSIYILSDSLSILIQDGMLSGTVEISAMGMMLSNYFQGIWII